MPTRGAGLLEITDRVAAEVARLFAGEMRPLGRVTAAQFQANPRTKGNWTFVDNDDVHRGSLDWAKEFAGGWSASAKVHGQIYDARFPRSSGTGRETTFGGVWQVRQHAEWFGHENVFTLGGEAMQDDRR